MALILRIKSRDGQVAEVPVQAGVVFGRGSGAQVQLDDPKLSSKHAQIKQIAPGQYIIEDLGSTNGIRDSQGKKVTHVKIEVGATFKMGSSDFSVENISRQKSAPARAPAPTPAAAAPPPPPAPKVAPVEPPPPPKWSEYFVKFVSASLAKIKNRPRELMPFNYILKLSFIRGLQAETVWTLGYGPREVGPSSLDLVIEEANAPAICFTVEPAGETVVFKTEHPNLVLLNERSVKSDTLKSGDVISIAQTRITVGFAE
jgi:pSer/pThr/pTyr-binding forkhead associated (FHA) protein